MRDVCIRHRHDGITELTPRLSPLDREDRWLIIFTILMASGGFFLAGKMPAPVLAAVLSACLAGEVVLGLKALVLMLLRPPAEVVEIPVRQLRRHAR